MPVLRKLSLRDWIELELAPGVGAPSHELAPHIDIQERSSAALALFPWSARRKARVRLEDASRGFDEVLEVEESRSGWLVGLFTEWIASGIAARLRLFDGAALDEAYARYVAGRGEKREALAGLNPLETIVLRHLAGEEARLPAALSRALERVRMARVRTLVGSGDRTVFERAEEATASRRGLKRLAHSRETPAAVRSAAAAFLNGSFAKEEFEAWLGQLENEELAWRLLLSEWETLAKAKGTKAQSRDLLLARERVRSRLAALGGKAEDAGREDLDSFAYFDVFATGAVRRRLQAQVSAAARPFAAARTLLEQQADGQTIEDLYGGAAGEAVNDAVRGAMLAFAQGELEAEEALSQVRQLELVECVTVCWRWLLRRLAAKIWPRDVTPGELGETYSEAQEFLFSLRDDLKESFPSAEEFKSRMREWFDPRGEEFAEWGLSCYASATSSTKAGGRTGSGP